MSTMQDKIDELRRRQAEAHLGGGAERQERQREAGKLTARERVAALVDEGSFEEIGLFATHRATLFGMAFRLAQPPFFSGQSDDGRLARQSSPRPWKRNRAQWRGNAFPSFAP